MTTPTSTDAPEPQPLVELRGVRKSFGGVHALKGVDLVIPPATVVGLAGENGAGKSTLLKILSGIYTPDAGSVLYDGVPQEHVTPAIARNAGIGAVTQELSLFEHLNVAENILISQEPMRGPFVDRKHLHRRAAEVLEQVGASVSPTAMIRDLSFADRQLVEIAKALVSEPRVLVLDEPTSGLREAEVDRLLETIRRLKQSGRSVIFITHRMSEMFAVCDRFTVLKDGESVASRRSEEIGPEELVRLMVGRSLSALYPEKPAAHQQTMTPLLNVSDFAIPGTQVRDVSLQVHPGEIVGIAGLAGNGQNELLEGIAGVRRGRGSLTVDGRTGPFQTARKALDAGIALVPEDRKRHGLVLPFSIQHNLTLPTLRAVSRFGFIRRRAEADIAAKSIEDLSIRPNDPSLEAAGLSGGNQQKIVIGKSLLAAPSVYVFADPTRGIDVGTKQEIYLLMRRLTENRKGILLLSTDLSEAIGVCDRVLVMSSGRVVAELSGDDLTEENVTHASFGGVAHAS
ncbi:sugar ABC transporter ATP-binding protein [Arthrobacter sp. FW306-05-C]|uniref:sugar ABC transporter ATP-binding protein n=1 Tax=Arthrobacter sp. FW306-05-C TaxID=2879620 RepID=UPI001F371C3D|nr:sugar ABC transporter ATP-binding protein [Arthrobacter sp. FW306-05-C]UKA66595.1 sugar ABC transporter ATP-binding protein [Arthrobacter sp. FW306-05-C]